MSPEDETVGIVWRDRRVGGEGKGDGGREKYGQWNPGIVRREGEREEEVMAEEANF